MRRSCSSTTAERDPSTDRTKTGQVFAGHPISQCRRYLDILHQAARDGLLDHKEVVAYHPRATIVIGRSDQWTDEQQRALHGLNRRMHGISVMTYDHLLAQGERLIDMMNPVSDDPAPAPAIEDDDIPW